MSGLGGEGEMPRFGAPHRHFRTTGSTNTRARELAEAGAPHGTVVTAGEQSEGRGRQGRTWTAPAGKALLYSAILRPLDERHLLLPLAVPIAVCEAAEELGDEIECAIKWPNDIWVEGRKLAGVLIEARPQDGWAVIGVGLNLTISREDFPEELRDSATSLFDPRERGSGGVLRSLPAVAPETLPRTLFTAAKALSRHLDSWVGEEAEAALSAWRARDALHGREIGWDGGSGVAQGIDEAGRLLVRVADGELVALGAGEVHLRL